MQKGAEQNFIYVLKCPSTGEIRYVGKTESPTRRLSRHMRDSANGASHHCGRWIRKLLSAGLKPVMEIVRVLEASQNWQEAEIQEIRRHKEQGCRLTNCTDGGEGATLTDPDLVARRNSKVKAALAKPEVRQKLSDSLTAHWTANPEAREKMSAKQKALASCPAERAVRSSRMSNLWSQKKEVMLASQGTPEFRKAHSERITKTWANPEIRNKMEEVNRNPASRQKKSDGAKQRWQDPAHRALAVEKAKARATPEYRAMMAEKTRLSWEKRRATTALKKIAQQETGE